MLTILTPTFNRAHTLPRLYASLLRQDSNDFEWLVIDDGSTDNTRELIESYIKEGKVNIRYYYKENGGKHRALNFGVPKAKGEFITILDSDDLMVDGIVEKIISLSKLSLNDEKSCGISGLKLTFDGKPMGTGINAPFLICSCIALRQKYNFSGEFAEVFKTSIFKNFIFPEFDGEKFLSEGGVLYKIAQSYHLTYYNIGFKYCEYQEDGLTKHFEKSLEANPCGALILYREMSRYSIKLKYRILYGYLYSVYYLQSSKTKRRKVPPTFFIKALFPLFASYRLLRTHFFPRK